MRTSTDIAYRTIDTPVGSLLLAATQDGLVRIAFERADHDAVRAELAETVSPYVVAAPDRLEQAAREIAEYFDGSRRAFGIPLDRRLSAGFRRAALDRVEAIDYGRTGSYQEVAAAAGSAGAVRAVGTACATNPLPVVVPCHRVVRADGASGGYTGGVAAKELLLALEAAA